MNQFKADLHMHTVLSPCGSLEMNPSVIVDEALKQGLDIIGITDHNTTKQCKVVFELGKEKGLVVICGAEVTTKEEVHCLTFFENFEKLEKFESYLDNYLPDVPNDTEMFGHQVWVNREEEIVGEESRLLISGIDQSIEEVEAKVRSLGGLFIPAHVDKGRFSLYSQLGFMPFDLKPDAIGLSANVKDEFLANHKELENYTLLRSSDAHQPDLIGSHYSIFEMEHRTFEEIRMALHQTNGRRVCRTV